MRRTSAAIAAICGLLALPVATAASQAAPRLDCTALRARLAQGGGTASGLLAIDGETGRTLCAKAPRRRRPLASNMKLFTTATALARMGPEARIETTVEADGTVDRGGTLHGSLYLVGGGDPTLGTPSFYRRYLGGLGTNLFALKAQIRTAGIEAITGRLYADDSVFDRLRGVADSSYATSPYIGPLSGLAFNSGFAGNGFSSDPARTAATTLARSLRAAGVHVPAAVGLATAPPDSQTVAAVESPPLTEIVDTTDVYSDNFFAETLIKLLGARYGGAGTTAAGARVVERFARSQGSAVHAVDGSGLTRSNRASPADVVGLLRSVRHTTAGEALIQDMALAGHEGTVADRMHGTAAYGRCRTKTGTLTGVSNLSGYCFDRSGHLTIFSILMSGVRDLSLAHLEQDLIAGEIASY